MNNRTHITQLDDPSLLPFAKSRLKAMRKLGLKYVSQQFDVGGSTVKVRVAGDDEYISISGGMPLWMLVTIEDSPYRYSGDPNPIPPFAKPGAGSATIKNRSKLFTLGNYKKIGKAKLEYAGTTEITYSQAYAWGTAEMGTPGEGGPPGNLYQTHWGIVVDTTFGAITGFCPVRKAAIMWSHTSETETNTFQEDNGYFVLNSTTVSTTCDTVRFPGGQVDEKYEFSSTDTLTANPPGYDATNTRAGISLYDPPTYVGGGKWVASSMTPHWVVPNDAQHYKYSKVNGVFVRENITVSDPSIGGRSDWPRNPLPAGVAVTREQAYCFTQDNKYVYNTRTGFNLPPTYSGATLPGWYSRDMMTRWLEPRTNALYLVGTECIGQFPASSKFGVWDIMARPAFDPAAVTSMIDISEIQEIKDDAVFHEVFASHPTFGHKPASVLSQHGLEATSSAGGFPVFVHIHFLVDQSTNF